MPAIRPVLIVGAGDHADLAAALRARGIGPILAPDVDQALRLLRNFRVDLVICAGLAVEAIARLAAAAPTVIVGGSEPDAWSAGAAGFVGSGATPAAVLDVVFDVARGERRVASGTAARDRHDIA